MRKYYPDLVETYEESIKKPVKVKKTRQKKDKENQDPDKPKRKYNRKKKVEDLEIVNNSLKRLSLDATGNTSKAQVSISVSKLKRKLKNNVKTKHIDSYFKSKKRKCSTSKIHLSFQKCHKSSKSDEPISNLLNLSRKMETMKNLSFFNSSTEEVDISNLSDIVDQIVTRGSDIKTASVNNNLVKLIFEKNIAIHKKSAQRNFIQNYCSTPKSSPRKKRSIDISKRLSKVNTSYFFDKLTDDCDAFEMSVEHKANDVNYDCNVTVDCSLPDVIL